jgi:vacuolar-type H+-ATPase subunit H
MSGQIEETLKALAEFESALDRARADASEAKRQMMKDAADWSESARGVAIEKARAIASETVSKARKEAESQAEKIRDDGKKSLKTFESSISKNMKEGTELVLRLLLGESE